MLLVDAHVHLHGCFDPAEFLDAAAANFAAAARTFDQDRRVAGVLAFTEVAGVDRFRLLRERAATAGSAWRVEQTGEDISLVASRPGWPVLTLIAGRQVATSERLEVLALGLGAHPPEGASLADTVARVQDAGAVPVLPWGFGKWWFGRGCVVQRFLRQAARGPVFLGDNGGRWRRAPEPALFEMAAQRDIIVLPGSDPLPFPDELARVGTYGFVLEAPTSEPSRPGSQLLTRVRGLEAQPPGFGRRVTLARFMANQTRMHWRKRQRKQP